MDRLSLYSTLLREHTALGVHADVVEQVRLREERGEPLSGDAATLIRVVEEGILHHQNTLIAMLAYLEALGVQPPPDDQR